MWHLDNEQTGVSYKNTSGDANHIVLNMLQECVQYSISVRAYTTRGPGPFSTAVVDSSLNCESCMTSIQKQLNDILHMTPKHTLRSHNLQRFFSLPSLQPQPTSPGAVLWKRTIQSFHTLLMSLLKTPTLLIHTA